MANKLKHLEFIQLVITRMNVNSFLLKGWSVTLVAALSAFAAKDTNNQYILIAFIPVPIFWFLDGYYLSQERQYRGLYNSIKDKDEADIDFDMNAKEFDIDNNKWIPSVFSVTLSLFYITLFLVTSIVLFILN